MAAKLEKVLYTAKIHTTSGRDGRAVSDEGLLDVQLNPQIAPRKGPATNPSPRSATIPFPQERRRKS
jgi:organic hydroperoxide reductase OsmC/OhrA